MIKANQDRTPKTKANDAPAQSIESLSTDLERYSKDHPYARQIGLEERFARVSASLTDRHAAEAAQEAAGLKNGRAAEGPGDKIGESQSRSADQKFAASDSRLGVLAIPRIVRELSDSAVPEDQRKKTIEQLSWQVRQEPEIIKLLGRIITDAQTPTALRVAAVSQYPFDCSDAAMFRRQAGLLGSSETPIQLRRAFAAALADQQPDLTAPQRALLLRLGRDGQQDFEVRCDLALCLARNAASHCGYGEKVLELTRGLVTEGKKQGLENSSKFPGLYEALGVVGEKPEGQLFLKMLERQPQEQTPDPGQEAISALAELQQRNPAAVPPQLKELLLSWLGRKPENGIELPRLAGLEILCKMPDRPAFSELLKIAGQGGLETSTVFQFIAGSGGPAGASFLYELAFPASGSRSETGRQALHALADFSEHATEAALLSKLFEQAQTLVLKDNELRAPGLALLEKAVQRGQGDLKPEVLEVLRELAESKTPCAGSARCILSKIDDPQGGALAVKRALNELNNKSFDWSKFDELAAFIPEREQGKLSGAILKQLAGGCAELIEAETLLKCLKQPATPAEAAVVRRYLNAPSDSVQFYAAAALARGGDAEGLARLVKLGETSHWRASALRALVECRQPAATATLLGILASTEDIVARTAVNAAFNGKDLRGFASRVRGFAAHSVTEPAEQKRLNAYAAALEKCASPQLDISNPARFTIDGLIDIVKNRMEGPQAAHGRKIAVIVAAKADHNGAMVQDVYGIEQLRARGYQVMYHEIGESGGRGDSVPARINAAIRASTATPQGKIIPADFLCLTAHGYPKGMLFGEDIRQQGDALSGPDALSLEGIKQLSLVSRHIRPGASACLISCSTGYGENMPGLSDNMANAVRQALPQIRSHRIIAPTEPTMFFEFRFDKQGRVIDAGFTTPRHFARADGPGIGVDERTIV